MQQFAYTVQIRIDNEEYKAQTNEFKLVLDLIHSTFEDEYMAISYYGMDGLDFSESSLPAKYVDRFEEEGKFLVCDPSVYVQGDDVVVAGSTDFHGMGHGIEVRIPKDAVSLESRVDEDSWARHKHQFDGFLSKEDVLEPHLGMLPVEESDEVKVPEEIQGQDTLDFSDEDELAEFARRVGGTVKDDLTYARGQDTNATGVVLEDGTTVVPGPQHGSLDEATDVEITHDSWFMDIYVDVIVVEELAKNEFTLSGEDVDIQFPTRENREELGFYDE